MSFPLFRNTLTRDPAIVDRVLLRESLDCPLENLRRTRVLILHHAQTHQRLRIHYRAFRTSATTFLKGFMLTK